MSEVQTFEGLHACTPETVSAVATPIGTMTEFPTVGGMGYVFVEAAAWEGGVETKFTTAGGGSVVTVIVTTRNREWSWTEVTVSTTEFADAGAVYVTESPFFATDFERVPQEPVHVSARDAPTFVMSFVSETTNTVVAFTATVAAGGATETLMREAADTPSVAVPPRVDWARLLLENNDSARIRIGRNR